MKPKLLIIDDDDEIRTQLTWALKNDYEIFQADDRLSAMKMFRDQHPQVALLDLGLPLTLQTQGKVLPRFLSCFMMIP